MSQVYNTSIDNIDRKNVGNPCTKIIKKMKSNSKEKAT